MFEKDSLKNAKWMKLILFAFVCMLIPYSTWGVTRDVGFAKERAAKVKAISAARPEAPYVYLDEHATAADTVPAFRIYTKQIAVESVLATAYDDPSMARAVLVKGWERNQLFGIPSLTDPCKRLPRKLSPADFVDYVPLDQRQIREHAKENVSLYYPSIPRRTYSMNGYQGNYLEPATEVFRVPVTIVNRSPIAFSARDHQGRPVCIGYRSTLDGKVTHARMNAAPVTIDVPGRYTQTITVPCEEVPRDAKLQVGLTLGETWIVPPPPLVSEASDFQVKVAISQPKFPGGKLAVTPGEGFLFRGWWVSAALDNFLEVFLNGKMLDLRITRRLDVEKLYPKSVYCNGYEVQVPAESIRRDGMNVLELKIGNKTYVTRQFQVVEPNGSG